jgi:hypothetical protein
MISENSKKTFYSEDESEGTSKNDNSDAESPGKLKQNKMEDLGFQTNDSDFGTPPLKGIRTKKSSKGSIHLACNSSQNVPIQLYKESKY